MKKLTALAAAAAFITTPAFAQSLTAEFAPQGADAVNLVFDLEAGTAIVGEDTVDFSYDPAAKRLCIDAEALCADFETGFEVPEVGFSTAYSATNGETGTMTILSVE